MATAEELKLAIPTAAEDMVDRVLDRVYQVWVHAVQESNAVDMEDFWVRKVDGNGNVLVEPNKWWQLERSLRHEVITCAELTMRLNLDGRRVKMEEAEIFLLESALRIVLGGLGLSEDQQAKVGPLMREAHMTLEGQVIESDTRPVNTEVDEIPRRRKVVYRSSDHRTAAA